MKANVAPAVTDAGTLGVMTWFTVTGLTVNEPVWPVTDPSDTWRTCAPAVVTVTGVANEVEFVDVNETSAPPSSCHVRATVDV